MRWSAEVTGKALTIREEDRYLLSLDPDTTGGRMVLVRGLEWGISTEVLTPSADPLSGISKAHKNTLISLVPLQLERILENAESVQKLNRFRVVLLGGGPVSEHLIGRLAGLHPAIFHTYGMTETCSHIALKRLNGNSPDISFVPFEGVDLSLSEEGTLVIDSPSASPRPLYTNDLARIHPDGSFDILGRKDFTVISGGIKINLEEIEGQLEKPLRENQINGPFFLWGLPDKTLGQRLVLFINDKPSMEESELLSALKAVCPRYKAPKAIIFAPRFYFTVSGKVDRIKSVQEWEKTS